MGTHSWPAVKPGNRRAGLSWAGSASPERLARLSGCPGGRVLAMDATVVSGC